MSKAENKSDPETSVALQLAWNYFSLHAGQRLTVFNHFLIVASLTLASLGACLRASHEFSAFGIAIGIILTFVTVVFWKLDERTSKLAKHAENVIKKIENTYANSNLALFCTEEAKFLASRNHPFFLMRVWSYSESFRVVFFCAGFCGISGSLVCAMKFFRTIKGLG